MNIFKIYAKMEEFSSKKGCNSAMELLFLYKKRLAKSKSYTGYNQNKRFKNGKLPYICWQKSYFSL
jgi:hypothetical protein